MQGCSKCMGMMGLMLLIVGVLFLLVDLGIWTFWGISWWTMVFLIMAMAHFGMKKCPDCQGMAKKK